jgi:hypothetical protein
MCVCVCVYIPGGRVLKLVITNLTTKFVNKSDSSYCNI